MQDTCARNVSDVANRCVFSMICGSCCSKSRLVEAAGAEGAAEMRCEKLHAAVARSRFVSQNVQNTSGAEPFSKLRSAKMARRCGAKHICQSKCTKHLIVGAILQVSIRGKWHAAVARSTFVSRNVQNTSLSEPFCKSRSGKMARRCGAKHICKSKCTKHLIPEAILQVTIRKNGTPLWREAHL